uniref:Uncharacterized protein n=1 Tax=Triticum urartu TaxID=4572 RepID=A0A8R7QLN7_TRIUA
SRSSSSPSRGAAPTRSRRRHHRCPRRRRKIPRRCAWGSLGSATSGSSSPGASSGRATPCWPPPDPTTLTTAPPTGFASSEAWRRCARSSRTGCWFAAPSSPRSPSSAPPPSPCSAPTPSSPTCSPSSSSPATSSSRYLHQIQIFNPNCTYH